MPTIPILAPPSFRAGYAAPTTQYRIKYPQLQRGLVGAWSAGLGPQGYTLQDQSGNNNHGALTGYTVPPDYSDGLLFDGTNDYTLHPRTEFGSTGQGTIAAWVNLKSKPAFGTIASEAFDSVQTNNVFQFDYRSSSDRFRFITFVGGGVYIANANTFGSPPTDQWVFVVGRYHTDDSIDISVNGGGFDSLAGGAINAVSNAVVQIGKQVSVSRYFDGLIDDVRIYNRALPAQEIKLLASRRNIAYEIAARYYSVQGAAAAETILDYTRGMGRGFGHGFNRGLG